MARRKRHGRFRREIKRFTSEQFAQSLQLFIDALDTRAEAFKPEGLPSFIAMQQRCVHYPDFAKAFAASRNQRIARLCERGLTAVVAAQPVKVGRGRPKYKEEDLEASIEGLAG